MLHSMGVLGRSRRAAFDHDDFSVKTFQTPLVASANANVLKAPLEVEKTWE